MVQYQWCDLHHFKTRSEPCSTSYHREPCVTDHGSDDSEVSVDNSSARGAMHSDTDDNNDDDNDNDNAVQIMDKQDQNVGVSIIPIQTTQQLTSDENRPPAIWGDDCTAKKNIYIALDDPQ